MMRERIEELREHAVEAMARFLGALIARVDDDSDMLGQVAEYFVLEAERRVVESNNWRDIAK